ncbi:MAG: hypothetical protein GC154_10925 [bacterium]|nr:hypothetical protein [bacterium]
MTRLFHFAPWLLLACLPVCSAQPLVIAHRGNSSVAPENTLASFRAAVELDPQPAYVELDIHRSSDGVLVVCHDEDTARTTGVPGLIREQPFAALRKLDAGYAAQFGGRFKNERLPRLEEVLDLVKDTPVGVMIECKQLLVEDQVIDILRKRNELDKHVLASFDEMTIYRAKQIEPRLRTLYLAGELNDVGIWRGKDVNADIIGAQFKSSLDSLARAREKGFKVWVWTVDDEDMMKTLFNAPVDGLITNHPARALSVLKAMN